MSTFWKRICNRSGPHCTIISRCKLFRIWEATERHTSNKRYSLSFPRWINKKLCDRECPTSNTFRYKSCTIARHVDYDSVSIVRETKTEISFSAKSKKNNYCPKFCFALLLETGGEMGLVDSLTKNTCD